MITIYGSKYVTKKGAFTQMKDLPEFERALFIFNDNEREHGTAKKGSGNADMRPYNFHGTPDGELVRSHGIPTGEYRQGYMELDDHTKEVIDESIQEIKDLIDHFGYDKIVYSIKDIDDIIIGTSIFKVDHEVLVYITREILKLGRQFTIIEDGKTNPNILPIDEDFMECIV